MGYAYDESPFVPFNVPQVGPTIPAMPPPDMRDAEITKLRADLDQARRDRNSAVECAEVLRGYVAEGKAEIAKLRAERDEWRDKAHSLNEDRAAARDAVFKEGLARIEAEKQLAAARAALDGYKSPEAAHNLAMRAIEESHRANRAEAALNDCRAALDGEREACDAWRKAWKRYDETRTVPAYSLLEDAADNHDARRAAEAKASRGGEGGA